MRRRLALPAFIAVAALTAAACSGGGGDSIIDAGEKPVVTTVASLPPGDTTPGPTTTASPLDSLPECPTAALADATGPVNITFWHGMNSDVLNGELTRITNAYNASQSKVKVKLVDQGGYESVIEKYLQSGQSNRPDMAQMPEYMVQSIVDTDSAVPAANCIASSGYDTSQFLPTALNAYATEGVQWSMPFNISDPVLFYNKKMFAAAGLDPDVAPATLDEVRAFSQKIVDAGVAPFGLALESGFDSGGGWFLEQWFAQAGEFYADNDNGRSARATQVLYDNASGVSLLTQLQSMINDGIAVNVGDNSGTGFDNLLKLADSTAPAAMTIATSASLGSVIDILKGGQFPSINSDDVGVAPLPGPQGAKGALVGGASLWVVNSGDPARIAATWDYITYLVAAEQQSSWSAVTGYIAVRNDARDLDPLKSVLAADPRFAVALDQLLSLPKAPTSVGPVLGPLREVRVVTAQGIAAIFAGADVQTTLTATKQQADALIADYNARNS